MKIKITKTIIIEIIMGIGILAILFNMGSIVLGQSNFNGNNNSGLTDNEVYTIPQKPTDLQKELYKSLSEEVKIETDDQIKVADLVVKNFIADYYTWTNKSGSYDVGGLTYIVNHSYLYLMESSRLNFYKDLDAFALKYGKDQLIEVQTITTNPFYAADFTFLDVNYKAYYIEAEWTYVPRDEFPEEQFQMKAAFTVIDYNGVMQIAQFLVW